MEPPSPIAIEQKVSADHMSDDPLSNSVFMIMGSASDECQKGGFCVCAWSAYTGLSYIGTPDSTIS